MKRTIYLLTICILCLTGWAGAGEPVMVTSVEDEFKEEPNTLLLRAAAKELGLKVRFRTAPFKRRLIMMENGDVDMICGLLYRQPREAYIHYVHPPYKTRSDTIFFVRKKNWGKITAYEDLRGLKIGVTRGSKYFERFDQDNTLTKEPALSESNFKKLLLGRIDTVIRDESSGIFLIHKLNVADRIAMSPFRFSREKKVYFGISRKSWMMEKPDRLEHIEQRLNDFITSGRARAIITGYYSRHGLPVPAM